MKIKIEENNSLKNSVEKLIQEVERLKKFEKVNKELCEKVAELTEEQDKSNLKLTKMVDKEKYNKMEMEKLKVEIKKLSDEVIVVKSKLNKDAEVKSHLKIDVDSFVVKNALEEIYSRYESEIDAMDVGVALINSEQSSRRLKEIRESPALSIIEMQSKLRLSKDRLDKLLDDRTSEEKRLIDEIKVSFELFLNIKHCDKVIEKINQKVITIRLKGHEMLKNFDF